MAFCYKCGQKLPEGANFCVNCGAPVIEPVGTRERAQTGPGRTRAAAPRGADKRQAIVLLALAAAVMLAVIVALVIHDSAGTHSSETAQAQAEPADGGSPREEPETATPAPTEPPETAEPETAQTPEDQTMRTLFDGLLIQYQDIIDSVLAEVNASSTSEWVRQYNCGYMYDYDLDGYPELVALYSADGMQLHALLARRLPDGTTRCLDQYVCDLAGGAGASIYFGMLANVPMFHIIYQNYDGDMQIGRDTIVEFTADSDFALNSNLTWEESLDGSYGKYCVNGEEDEAVFQMLFGSKSYWECSFPNEDCLPLENVIQEYLLTPGRGE